MAKQDNEGPIPGPGDGRHRCQVMVRVAEESEAANAVVLMIRCEDCGDHEISIPMDHIPTVYRVLESIGRQAGIELGSAVALMPVGQASTEEEGWEMAQEGWERWKRERGVAGTKKVQ